MGERSVVVNSSKQMMQENGITSAAEAVILDLVSTASLHVDRHM
jgi:hypothetical protein